MRNPKNEKAAAKNGTKLATKRKRRAPKEEANWGVPNAGLIQQLIINIAEDGGACRFGYTRDGGAYSVGIYGDGDPFTEYCGANEDVDAWLDGFISDYQ